jgi:hypothetical protein
VAKPAFFLFNELQTLLQGSLVQGDPLAGMALPFYRAGFPPFSVEGNPGQGEFQRVRGSHLEL